VVSLVVLSVVDISMDDPLYRIHERLHMRPVETTDFGKSEMTAIRVVYLLKYRIYQLGSEDIP
jgi:hypothetical protein